jgi:hypothetical protein
LSHRQSDKKRSSSVTSELIKIDDQELFQALEVSCPTEEFQIIEKEPIENLAIREESMEPTISEIASKEVESFIDSPSVNEMDTKYIKISNEQLESKIISKIVDSLTEDLNNLKLSDKVNSENKLNIEKLNVINLEEEATILKENLSEEKCSDNKACWTEMVDNGDNCECPKAINIKKVKKDEEPMLFEGIKFKGKKKKSRKKNQPKDIIKLPTESHIKNTANNIVKLTKKKNQVIEEDCDSALSVDHSIDTNDAPNTIYSDIRSEVSL